MRAGLRLAALVVIAAALGAGRAARAEEPPPASVAPVASVADGGTPSLRAQAEASFARAEQAQAAGRFGEARQGYREALALDPRARFAPIARARAADLDAHAEGDFAPLAKLEALRRAPGGRGDRAAITTLEQEIPSFPVGRVRSEAALLAAEAWWHELGEPRRAIAGLTFALEDSAADRLTRSFALSELVALRRELGEFQAARELVDRYPDLSPETRALVLRLVRRTRLRAAAIFLLALLAVIGLGALARAARRPGGLPHARRAVVRPLAIAAALCLGGAGAMLARLGGGDPRPFLLLGLGVAAIDMIARTWQLASGDQRAHARLGRAMTCAAGVLAVAFLTLERTNASYLARLGL